VWDVILGGLLGDVLGWAWYRRKVRAAAEELAPENRFFCALRLVEGFEPGLNSGSWRADVAHVTAGRIRIEGNNFPVRGVDASVSRAPTLRESMTVPIDCRIYPAIGTRSRLELAVHPDDLPALLAALLPDDAADDGRAAIRSAGD
jgi:hypothetical protein